MSVLGLALNISLTDCSVAAEAVVKNFLTSALSQLAFVIQFADGGQWW